MDAEALRKAFSNAAELDLALQEDFMERFCRGDDSLDRVRGDLKGYRELTDAMSAVSSALKYLVGQIRNLNS